mgnify:CR=1 FL=1
MKKRLTNDEIIKLVNSFNFLTKNSYVRSFIDGWRACEKYNKSLLESNQTNNVIDSNENLCLIELLKESRSILLLQALFDKHNYCINMVNKIDNILTTN